MEVILKDKSDISIDESGSGPRMVHGLRMEVVFKDESGIFIDESGSGPPLGKKIFRGCLHI